MLSFSVLLLLLLNFLSLQADILENESLTSEDDVVNVELYYETNCPSCKEFISGTFNTSVSALSDKLNVLLVPYGNVMKKDGKLHCQHGADECYGNKLHGCWLVQEGGATLRALHFIACMESFDDTDSVDTHADKCGKELNIDTAPLKKCANSKVGDYLFSLNGELTEKARPMDHQYVPYCLLNGVEMDTSEPFLDQLCALLDVKPEICSN